MGGKGILSLDLGGKGGGGHCCYLYRQCVLCMGYVCMGYVKYLGLRNESIVNMRRYMDRAASRWYYKNIYRLYKHLRSSNVHFLSPPCPLFFWQFSTDS